MTPFLVAAIVAATLALVVTVYAWVLDARAELNRWVVVTGLVLVVRTFFVGLSLSGKVPPDLLPLWQVVVPLTIVFIPLSLSVNLIFAGVKRRTRWKLVVPTFVFSLAEVVHRWVAPGTLPTYATYPGFGLPDSLEAAWTLGYLAFVEVSQLTSLGALIWSYRKTRSRRYRAILLQLFVVILAGNLLSLLFSSPLWRSWGWPDATVLLSGVHAVNYLLLISRFRALMNDERWLASDLFPGLPEHLLVADADGRIVQVSQPLARVLGLTPQALSGRSVFEVLSGWPELRGHWHHLAQGHGSTLVHEAPLAGLPWRLKLTGVVATSGEVEGVLVSLRPAGRLEEVPARLGLSGREREVAQYLAEGWGTTDIANALSLSTVTVKNHINKMLQRTGARNRVELVNWLRGPSSPGESDEFPS